MKKFNIKDLKNNSSLRRNKLRMVTAAEILKRRQSNLALTVFGKKYVTSFEARLLKAHLDSLTNYNVIFRFVDLNNIGLDRLKEFLEIGGSDAVLLNVSYAGRQHKDTINSSINYPFIKQFGDESVYLLSTTNFDLYLKLIKRCLVAEINLSEILGNCFFAILAFKEQHLVLDGSSLTEDSKHTRELYANATGKNDSLIALSSLLSAPSIVLPLTFSETLLNASRVTAVTPSYPF